MITPGQFESPTRFKNQKRTMARRSALLNERPPDGQPYLISSRKDLELDKKGIAAWQARWEARFPGEASTLNEKLEWTDGVERDVEVEAEQRQQNGEGETEDENDQDACPKFARPLDSEVLASILLSKCTEEVEICLVVSRAKVRECLTALIACESTFLNCSERRRAPFDADYRDVGWRAGVVSTWGAVVSGVRRLLGKRRRAESEASLPAFCDYLERAPPGTEMRRGGQVLADETEVLVASLTCLRYDVLQDKLSELVTKLGMLKGTRCSSPCATTHGQSVASAFFRLNRLVGENLWFHDTSARKTRVPICLEVPDGAAASKKRKVEEDHADDEKMAALVEELEDAEKLYSNHTFIVVDTAEDEDEEDGEEVEQGEDEAEDAEQEVEQADNNAAMSKDQTADEGDKDRRDVVKVLWLPKFYDAEKKRLWSHCFTGEGETTEIKRSLAMGLADAAKLKFDIVQAELDALRDRFGRANKEADKESQKLCATLALSHAMVYDDHWLTEPQLASDVQDFVSKRLAKEWRDLLKLSNTKLGLGIPDHQLYTPAASHEALLAFLSIFQDAFESHDIKFNFTPRKRRNSEGGDA